MSLFQVFDVAGTAMNAQSIRLNVTASNLANAGSVHGDPSKVFCIDNAQTSKLSMQKTSELHKSAWRTNRLGTQLQYRIPTQPTLDGNTVETDVEQAAYAENVIQYRASLSFLNGQIRTLCYALKGGD